MASIVPGYEYDIFISYRQKDNKGDGWVNKFVDTLKTELEATFKDDISVYFDENPHDRLQETHNVDKSLEDKLKCLIFIPILSQTYCDPNSYAWKYEFLTFLRIADNDRFGRDVKLRSGNVANRILPIRIHDLDAEDMKMFEGETGSVLRAMDFVFKTSSGVNRPLKVYEDHPNDNLNKTFYSDQINKVANAIKEIILGMKTEPANQIKRETKVKEPNEEAKKEDERKELINKAIFNQKSKKWMIILLSVFLFVAGAFAIFITREHSKQAHNLSKLEKSIAVLPFVDLSPNHDKEYFSDGMMDEILNHLYKIGDLKVTSRTSSMQYKGETKKSVKEIAKELGVANILEGSVRLDKNTVRITVQLIRAATDEHLWAQDYDRDFSDIFSIQSEVAHEVAKALKAEISPEVQRIIDLKPTKNPEAYNLYLQAENLSSYIESNRNKSLELYKKAIELDPDFSLAYSAIGNTLTTWATYLSSSQVLDLQETWKTAKPYFEKALALNPDDGDSHIIFAWSLLWFEWNFKAADKEYQEGRRIFPNYSWTDYHLALGQFEEGYEGAIKNIDFDSKNDVSWSGVITSSYFANHDPESKIRKALTIPIIRDDILVRSESARIYMYLKEYDEAISLSKELLKDFPEVDSPRLDAIQAISFFNTNRPDETNRIIVKLKQRSEVNVGGSPSFYLAMIYAQTGKIDAAFEYLDKAYRDHEVEMYWLKVEPPFKPLHSDPRFQIMLDKIGYP